MKQYYISEDRYFLRPACRQAGLGTQIPPEQKNICQANNI